MKLIAAQEVRNLKMPPPWKLRRELLRLVRQAISAPGRVAEYLFSTLYYDHVLARSARVTDGALPACDRVAAYLIFPTEGVQGSHLEALRHLQAQGYAPLVVSNCQLSDDDRTLLSPQCWMLIERPNFGYDFGGYRHAVLWLLRNQPLKVERLALLNDSVWLNLPGTRPWLADAESLSVDFAGAASNYGADRVAIADFMDIRWRYSATHKSFHHCSFALLISKKLLSDPRFAQFWQGFRLSNNKKQTVRRGEIGLTQWVMRHGYSHADTLAIDRLDEDLEALPDSRLKQIFSRTIIPEDPRLQAAKADVDALIAGRPDNWREIAVKFILTAVSRQGASYTLSEYSIRERGFPFLKKSPVKLNLLSSDVTLQVAGDLGGPYGAVIVSEIVRMRDGAAERERTEAAPDSMRIA